MSKFVAKAFLSKVFFYKGEYAKSITDNSPLIVFCFKRLNLPTLER
jgi:hypothetical protein